MPPRIRIYIATLEDERAFAALQESESLIHGFFNYMGFDNPSKLKRCLNYSGRNYDMTAWSIDPRFSEPVTEREPLHNSPGKLFSSSKADKRRLGRAAEAKAAEILSRRQEAAELSEDGAEERLRRIFRAYSSLKAVIEGRGVLMDTIGFQRL
eukprot:CAMPEP_0177590010 /NCGR_PEP_ID=MMETSP0419_2-20121207/7145_1 /TAXON_ID=582737 /ORGANISM="Tetraselmis sp., Strain GSL018" /LENGTH=152 /DNA_ID=CAMNT_0019080475 /DNA_START=210 /DNA_END=665 /DNA_ORIENTATION=+